GILGKRRLLPSQLQAGLAGHLLQVQIGDTAGADEVGRQNLLVELRQLGVGPLLPLDQRLGARERALGGLTIGRGLLGSRLLGGDRTRQRQHQRQQQDDVQRQTNQQRQHHAALFAYHALRRNHGRTSAPSRTSLPASSSSDVCV